MVIITTKPVEKHDSQFLEEAISRIGSDLSLSQRTELQTLIFENKDLFGEKSGVTSLISHKIENTGVIFPKPCKLSMTEHDQTDKLMESMLKDGVVRTSLSPYNSPILMDLVDLTKLQKLVNILLQMCQPVMTSFTTASILQVWTFNQPTGQFLWQKKTKRKQHLQFDQASTNSMSRLLDLQTLLLPFVILWIKYLRHINGNSFYAL